MKFEMEEDRLRKKWKDRAEKAANGSRKEAIHLQCIACAGSSQEARKCSATYCFLHPYRPGI